MTAKNAVRRSPIRASGATSIGLATNSVQVLNEIANGPRTVFVQPPWAGAPALTRTGHWQIDPAPLERPASGSKRGFNLKGSL
jgi:hypothetical protein